MPSPKKGGRKSPTKGTVKGESLDSIEKRIFARKRYDLIETAFTQKSQPISIYVKSIHLYEVWNRLPLVEQFCNSNTNENASKSPKSTPKKSPKGKGKTSPTAIQSDEVINKPDHENAKLYGVVSVDKNQITNGYNLYVEITAEFSYYDHSKVPPFPERSDTKCMCYREVLQLSPRSLNDIPLIPFIDTLASSIKEKLGKGYQIFPFDFDLTQKPDSVFFNRPYYPNFTSGLFWSLRAFTAMDKDCDPLPGRYITMKIYKYTISPALRPLTMTSNPPTKYIRYSTRNDTGDLILEAQLDKDIYYHGQEIRVKISIENNSSRHVVQNMVVFVEQTYRLNHQFPHDRSIPLGEVVLNDKQYALPINPRGKWSKEVQVKLTFDQTKYNLAVDGKMDGDNKVFLASSTIIMDTKVIHEVVNERTESKNPSPKGSPKGKNRKGSPTKSKKGKSENVAPTDDKQQETNEQAPQFTTKTIHSLTNKQVCRSIFISYDVVVRLNLSNVLGEESGHPMVRVPFILTRETKFLDKLANPPPPTWSVIKPH
uniref:Arrestin C-terminal-like domain-containing protein n=1 Tax=Trichobilharzia regenti TaxID=157069 RepID=A0AA85JSQ9_TRIRE|nr:unnamed protein product [Trichobilharzia regenti]